MSYGYAKNADILISYLNSSGERYFSVLILGRKTRPALSLGILAQLGVNEMMFIIYKEQWKGSQLKYEKEYIKLFTTSSKHNTSTNLTTRSRIPIYIHKTLETRAFTYLFSHGPTILHTASKTSSLQAANTV